MRLLNSTFIVIETSALGTTAGGSSGRANDVGLTIRKIVAFGASSVAPNTSGGMKLNTYPNSSGDTASTFVLLPSPTSNGIAVTLDDLQIRCGVFEIFTNEAGEFGVYILGD